MVETLSRIVSVGKLNNSKEHALHIALRDEEVAERRDELKALLRFCDRECINRKNKEGQTLLHQLVQNKQGDVKILNDLWCFGADVKALDDNGQTVLENILEVFFINNHEPQ